ncbi:hypothetical protein QTO34_018596 [Cnephaeus nilssonii]|uniref:Iodothyronine deiodinase n=1 Tax=Cnephaeus nilssonii TaxID=3371016 RepID=A0AA40I055_CNENI|nr:hypothetical protein QTO34_018596 [Eptesicus nilssonii]
MGLLQPGLWLKRLWILLQVALHVTLGKVQLKLFPGRVKQHILAMNRKNPHFSYDNWAPTLFSTQYFWFVLKVRWQRLEDKTEEGGLAPNCPVVRLSGQRCNIWDFMQETRTFPGFCFSEGHQHLSLWALKPQTNPMAFSSPSTALTIRAFCLRCTSPPLCPVNSYASFRLLLSDTSCNKSTSASPD